MRLWTIELRIGGQVVQRIEAERSESHRLGDALATERHTDVECYAYNDALYKWQKMGTYRGNRVFTDSFGDDRLLKEDYSGMTAMPGKEAAV